MTVTAEEFIRRFLLHTLPAGFQRIRHFGFLANCHRMEKLALCRRLLTAPGRERLPLAAVCQPGRKPAVSAESLAVCRQCGKGVMRRIEILPAYRWPLMAPDTS